MKKILIVTMLMFPLCSQADSMPDGWVMAGSDPSSYTFELAVDQGRPEPSGYLMADDPKDKNGFGTVMQSFYPEEYLDKRVKLTAFMRAKGVADKASFWMRLDSNKVRAVSFDNMFDRAISGTKDWQQYEIVLDVPGNATNLSYGALLKGKGEIWFDEFQFTVVDKSVPLTGSIPPKRNSPINNSF